MASQKRLNDISFIKEMLQFGFRETSKRGHIYIHYKGARALEHRLIWRVLNGEIPDGFIIHHINEDKTDNRIQNLACILEKEHLEMHLLRKDITDKMIEDEVLSGLKTYRAFAKENNCTYGLIIGRRNKILKHKSLQLTTPAEQTKIRKED